MDIVDLQKLGTQQGYCLECLKTAFPRSKLIST